MSITPKSPAISQQGWVQTWVTSQWKNRPIPGRFSAEINIGDEGDSIAGKANPAITSAEHLKDAILAEMSEELKAVIDVVVLDVSRPPVVAKPPKKRGRRKKSVTATSP